MSDRRPYIAQEPQAGNPFGDPQEEIHAILTGAGKGPLDPSLAGSQQDLDQKDTINTCTRGLSKIKGSYYQQDGALRLKESQILRSLESAHNRSHRAKLSYEITRGSYTQDDLRKLPRWFCFITGIIFALLEYSSNLPAIRQINSDFSEYQVQLFALGIGIFIMFCSHSLLWCWRSSRKWFVFDLGLLMVMFGWISYGRILQLGIEGWSSCLPLLFFICGQALVSRFEKDSSLDRKEKAVLRAEGKISTYRGKLKTTRFQRQQLLDANRAKYDALRNSCMVVFTRAAGSVEAFDKLVPSYNWPQTPEWES